jgi:hypothetical protein
VRCSRCFLRSSRRSVLRRPVESRPARAPAACVRPRCKREPRHTRAHGVTASPTRTRPVSTTSPTTPSGRGSVVSTSSTPPAAREVRDRRCGDDADARLRAPIACRADLVGYHEAQVEARPGRERRAPGPDDEPVAGRPKKTVSVGSPSSSAPATTFPSGNSSVSVAAPPCRAGSRRARVACTSSRSRSVPPRRRDAACGSRSRRSSRVRRPRPAAARAA